MNRNELVDILSSTLLWEVISAIIEQTNQLSFMLEKVSYIDDKEFVISRIQWCEVFDAEPMEIISCEVQGGKIILDFEMPFLLSAWEKQTQVLRITALAKGKCCIPDVGVFAWEDLEWENMNKKGLLDKAELVELLEINYLNVECEVLT